MAAHAPEQTARLSDALFLACGLAWGAALLHVVAAADHVHGYVPFTAFFVLAGIAQAGWGIALYRGPSRALLVAGTLLSVAIAGLWIASRTSGLPIGPAAGVAKPVGGLESLATADEVVLAVLALVQLRPLRRGGRIAGWAGTPVALYLILLSSMSLMPGSPEHGVKGSLVSVPRAGFQFLCHPG